MSTLQKSLIVRKAIKNAGKKFILSVKAGRANIVGDNVKDAAILEALKADRSIIIRQLEVFEKCYVVYIEAA